MSRPNVSWFGLGAMGGGMAINLVKNGYPVTGYDVYKPLVDKLVEAGGKASTSPSEAASTADFLIIMVVNKHQVTSLLFDGPDSALKGLQKNKTIMLSSTTPPSYPIELRKLLDEAGRKDVKLVDCPVSGGTIRAAEGTLSIFAAGEPDDVQGATQVLETMAGSLYKIQGGVSGGTKVKTIHQLLASTNIITASEAMGLAATVGLNTQQVLDQIKTKDGTAFMFENRAMHMIANDWSPASALAIIWKDAGIVIDAGKDISFPMPVVSTAEQLYRAGNKAGYLRDDDAKLVQLYLPSNKGALVSELKNADTKLAASHQVSIDTVNDLLAGIHLAASVEAMDFCKALEMDRKLMADVIAGAAGTSAMFKEHIPGMLEADEWTLADCKAADSVRERLESAVQKCQAIRYPCPMALAALQQFYFARLRK